MTDAGTPFPSVALSERALLEWIRHGVDEHAIVAITDARGVIVFVNDQFCEISGYTRSELIGNTHRLVKSAEHPPEFFAEMWRTINAGKSWHGTICNRAKDGHAYWVESSIIPIPGDDGRPAYHLALRTDITRLKETELANSNLVTELKTKVAELRMAQSQIALFFEHAPIGLSWREFDRENHPTTNHVNRRFCELIGLNEAEARDMERVKQASHPDDWAKQAKLTEEIYAGKRNDFTMTKRYIHRDGRVMWGSLTVVVVRDSAGHVTHHFAMLADVTAQRAAEDELRRSEARWRTYLTTASEILYALTPDFIFKFVSPAWTPKLGHPAEAVVDRQFFEFVHPDDAADCREFIAAILAGRPAGNLVEYRMRHFDGRWIWHASTGSVYVDRDGRRAFFGVGRDISVRRQAQDELRTALARREEMERIIDRSPSVVVLWRAEADGWPVEFVSASIRQFGFSPEQFTNRQYSFGDITHPADRERVRAEVTAHAEAGHTEYNQEYRVVCADGSTRWVDDHTVVRHDVEGRVTHHEGLITDITTRKQVEEIERAARERDLRVAADVQQHLRPRIFPDINEVEIESLSTNSMHIGGDYYDVLAVDARRWGFVIADVSGKGAGAALIMAECRATLRLCAANELSPATVIRRLNRAIQPDMRPGMFIALFYGILDLDTNVLRFCRAGHEPALLLRRGSNGSELLPGDGLAVGLDEGAVFDSILEEREVALNPGDMVALYTDGITEARNSNGEEFSRDRLAAALLRHEDRSLPEVVRTVDRFVRKFSTLETQRDDSTLLLLRVR